MMKYDKTTKSYTVDDSRQADVAWAAGFFEGEGSITIYRTTSSHRPAYLGNVSCEQKCREPLDKLVSLFGGRIEPRHQGSWQWQVYGHQAKAFLRVVDPWIQTPHKQRESKVFQAYFSTTDRELRKRYLSWWRVRRAAAETECPDLYEEATVRTAGQLAEEHNNAR